MVGQDTHQVERKVTAILRILSDSAVPLGGRAISRRLKEHGVDLSERGVRYHLKIMDERGLTCQIGSRDGRKITPPGLEELKNALVCDKVGFVADRLQLLAYLTSFDPVHMSGSVPIDVSLFNRADFSRALEIMASVFQAGLCPSNLVAVAHEGEGLGETNIPTGKVGFATVCGAVVCGALLKAGIPVDFKFGGILQVRNREPARFIDLIEYHGSTVDPFEIFIAARMTSAYKAAQNGSGGILASFQEFPLPSRPEVEILIENLKASGLCSSALLGKTSEPLCKMPVRPNKVGLVVPSGLNAAAAVAEWDIPMVSKASSGVIPIKELTNFWDL